MIPRAHGDENLQGVVKALDIVEPLSEGPSDAISFHRHVCELCARAYDACGRFTANVQEMHVKDCVRDVLATIQAPDILVGGELRAGGGGRLRDYIRLARCHDGHDLGGQVRPFLDHLVKRGLGGLDVPNILRHHHGKA